jgi:hypothetical protein
VTSALAFIAAGFGVALVSQPIKDFPIKDVVFRDLWSPQPVGIPLGAAWKRNGWTLFRGRLQVHGDLDGSLCCRGVTLVHHIRDSTDMVH